MTTQLCSSCHTPLNISARFCHSCGKKVAAAPTDAQPPQNSTQTHSLKFVPLQEPREGAYTLNVPHGWQSSAAVQDHLDSSAIATWHAVDPSQTVTLIAPGVHHSFQEFVGPLLPGRRILRYLPATLFLKQLLVPQLQRENASMRVESITEHPELVAILAQKFRAAGENPATFTINIASVQFIFTRQGQTFRQRTLVCIMRQPAIRCWQADVLGMLCAPADQFEQYVPVFRTVLDSFKWNPQWLQARNMRLHMLAGQIRQQGMQKMHMAQAQMLQTQRTIMETGDIIRAGQARQMEAQDSNFNAIDNLVAGNIDLVSPNGQVYNVTNDFQQRHWIDALGVVHGGNANATPNPNWIPLTPQD